MYKLRFYACCLLWAVAFFALPAGANNKFCAGLPCGEVAIRDECAANSGDAQACATAPIVRTLAALETCWEANRRMCIVDGELVAHVTDAAPDGITITYTAVKQDTIIYFTTGGEKPSCIIIDNAQGSELSAAGNGLYILPDLALDESHTEIVDLCLKDRRGGVDIGHTVTFSGTVTSGTGNTLVDSAAPFGVNDALIGDAMVLRRGDTDEQIVYINDSTSTTLTGLNAWVAGVADATAGDTYEVWNSQTLQGFHYKHGDANVKHHVTLVRPHVTISSNSSASFAVGQNDTGCTAWTIIDAVVEASIGIDGKGTCTGLNGTEDATSAIEATNDTFDFPSAHPFATGDVIESGVASNGLSKWNPYYIIDVDSDTVALAYTKHDAIGLTWSAGVTWDVDLTGAWAPKTFTPIEQASYTINGGVWTALREVKTPRMIKVTGDLIVRIEDALVRGGGVSADIDTHTYQKVIIRNTIFDLPYGHVMAVTGDAGRTELFCRGVKVNGWGAARPSSDTSDLFNIDGNAWADCEVELSDGALADGSQSILDAAASGFLGDGARFMRLVVTTPMGVEFTDDATFEQIRAATPTGARGALIGRGGSSFTSVIIDGTYGTTSAGYPETSIPGWCTHDGTIVDGDSCCAYKYGLPCETVVGLDVPHASTTLFNICGEATTVNNNTVYYGPDITLLANTSGGQSCDINATGNVTEGTADAPILTNEAFYVTGMTCRNEADANAALSFTLRTAAGAMSPAIACTIADNERDCVGETTNRVALVAAGATVAVAVASTADIADGNGFACQVTGHPTPAVGLNSCAVDQRSGNSFLAECYSPLDF